MSDDWAGSEPAAVYRRRRRGCLRKHVPKPARVLVYQTRDGQLDPEIAALFASLEYEVEK